MGLNGGARDLGGFWSLPSRLPQAAAPQDEVQDRIERMPPCNRAGNSLSDNTQSRQVMRIGRSEVFTAGAASIAPVYSSWAATPKEADLA